MLFLNRAAVVRHSCKLVGYQLQIRITFIIPEQDIKTRIERFDQVVFQQQCLGLAAHHRGFHTRNFGHHVTDARAAMAFLKVI